MRVPNPNPNPTQVDFSTPLACELNCALARPPDEEGDDEEEEVVDA